jgi:superfamily II DNA/RNA helicase
MSHTAAGCLSLVKEHIKELMATRNELIKKSALCAEDIKILETALTLAKAEHETYEKCIRSIDNMNTVASATINTGDASRFAFPASTISEHKHTFTIENSVNVAPAAGINEEVSSEIKEEASSSSQASLTSRVQHKPHEITEDEKLEDEVVQNSLQSDFFTEDTTKNLAVIKSFDDMGLDEKLLHGIYSEGFETPSPIQQLGIIAGISGKDCAIQSQSGTGKSLTMYVPMLQHILNYRRVRHEKKPNAKPVLQAIIAVPTRVLAEQHVQNIINLTRYIDEGRKMAALIICDADESIESNVRELRNAEIAICTPNRLVDLIDQKCINLCHVNHIYLDEADVLLRESGLSNDNSFIRQIKTLVKHCKKSAQVTVVSTTMSDETKRVINSLLRPNCIKIYMKKEKLSRDDIQQFSFTIDMAGISGDIRGHQQCMEEPNRFKREMLRYLLNKRITGQTVIFVNSTEDALSLHEHLIENKYQCSILHEEQTSIERRENLKSFRSEETRFLVSTDVGARGIDVHQVFLVINYDLPCGEGYMDTYMHRIGRSGRHGRKGKAISFLAKNLRSENHGDQRGGGRYQPRHYEQPDSTKLHSICNYFKTNITPMKDDSL